MSWTPVPPEVFAEHWKRFVALPAPPAMAELATAPGRVVRKYFRCLVMKDEKLSTTLSEWFVLTIEGDIKELLALHKDNERREKEFTRYRYESSERENPALARSPNRDAWEKLEREEFKKYERNALYTGRYAYQLYLFSRAIQGCVTKDRVYDQEGWLESIRKQLALLEKTPRPE